MLKFTLLRHSTNIYNLHKFVFKANYLQSQFLYLDTVIVHKNKKSSKMTTEKTTNR